MPPYIQHTHRLEPLLRGVYDYTVRGDTPEGGGERERERIRERTNTVRSIKPTRNPVCVRPPIPPALIPYRQTSITSIGVRPTQPPDAATLSAYTAVNANRARDRLARCPLQSPCVTGVLQTSHFFTPITVAACRHRGSDVPLPVITPDNRTAAGTRDCPTPDDVECRQHPRRKRPSVGCQPDQHRSRRPVRDFQPRFPPRLSAWTSAARVCLDERAISPPERP